MPSWPVAICKMVCGIGAESGLSEWRLEIGFVASECLVCAYRVGRNCRLLLAMAGSEAGRQLVAAFARRRFPGAFRMAADFASVRGGQDICVLWRHVYRGRLDLAAGCRWSALDTLGCFRGGACPGRHGGDCLAAFLRRVHIKLRAGGARIYCVAETERPRLLAGPCCRWGSGHLR